MLGHLRRSTKLAAPVFVSGQAVRCQPYCVTAFRSYHSYPDPNEKPIIHTSKSTQAKTYNKDDPAFQLAAKFKLDKLFPGVDMATGIGATQSPPTITTTLDNGLSVASQELPGMMTSIALLVKTGRCS
jgi:hypothetical protein